MTDQTRTIAIMLCLAIIIALAITLANSAAHAETAEYTACKRNNAVFRLTNGNSYKMDDICRGPDAARYAKEVQTEDAQNNARLDALDAAHPELNSAYNECLFRGHAFLSPGTMIYGGANQTMMNIEAYCSGLK